MTFLNGDFNIKVYMEQFEVFVVNDCRKYCYVYLLRNKYQALELFKYYKIKV